MSRRNTPSPSRRRSSKNSPISPKTSSNKLRNSLPGQSDASETRRNDSKTQPRTPDKSRSSISSVEASTNRIGTIGGDNESGSSRSTQSAGDKIRNGTTSAAETRGRESIRARKLETVESENEQVKKLSRELSLVKIQVQRMRTIVCRTDERIRIKDQQIDRLKGKVKEWEAKYRNQEMIHERKLLRQGKQVENSEYLSKRCHNLEQKLSEMEKFLADYGLVWIGDRDGKCRGGNARIAKDYWKNCFHRILANIESLNMSVGKDEVHVHRDKRGACASFKTSPCVSLKFYKNGLVVQNGRIRRYDDSAVTSFIRDILDGYFPAELQRRYPDGVPFKVEDHRSVDYRGPDGGFPGYGHRLGKPRGRVADERIYGSSSSSSSKRDEGRAAPSSGGSGRFGTSHGRRGDCCSTESTAPSVSSSVRSPASKSFVDDSTADVTDLRSQILASHNHHCSDSHIQSHINAELARSARNDKNREVATKSVECRMPAKERATRCDDSRATSQRSHLTASRTNCRGSTDRSSSGMSLSGSRIDGDGSTSRWRSTSLPARRSKPRSLSKLRLPPGDDYSTPSTPRWTDHSYSNGIPRASKSANLERPRPAAANSLVVKQVNQPTERPNDLRIKVRSVDGTTIWLVHLSADDTVEKLYRLLDTCIIKTRSRRYKIVLGGYAPRRLDRLGASLREYGITRDCVMHVMTD